MNRSLLAVLAWAFAAAACGAPAAMCVPNEVRSCTTDDSRAGTQRCNFSGTSFSTCLPNGSPTPDCANIECGPSRNLASVSCGSCGAGARCEAGSCVTARARDCVNRQCGPDGIGGTCGSCGAGRACSTEGQCVVIGCDPACSRGYTCVSGTCQLDLDSRWDLVAVSARVPESGSSGAWDPFGGLPDPYICYTVGSSPPSCSSYVADRTMVTWNFLVGTYSARTLMTSPQTYTIFDDDPGPDDVIALTTSSFTISEAMFAERGWSSSGYATTVFQLTPSTR